MQPVSGISPTEAGRGLERSELLPPDLTATGSRFAELLAHEPAALPAPEVGAPSTLSQVLGHHAETYQKLLRDMQAESQNLRFLSPQEVTYRETQMMMRVVSASAEHNAYTYIAQGCKNGLQTLMKNQ